MKPCCGSSTIHFCIHRCESKLHSNKLELFYGPCVNSSDGGVEISSTFSRRCTSWKTVWPSHGFERQLHSNECLFGCRDIHLSFRKSKPVSDSQARGGHIQRRAGSFVRRKQEEDDKRASGWHRWLPSRRGAEGHHQHTHLNRKLSTWSDWSAAF